MVHDLHGVGQNLQDHIAAYGMTWLTKTEGVAYNPFLYTADPRTYWNWKTVHRGPLAAPIGVEAVAFLSSKFANTTWPDLQLTFVSTHPGFDGGTTYKDFLGISDEFYEAYFEDNSFKEGFTIYPSLNRPKSRGSITLKSANPYDHPIIQPNYLSDRRDIEALVEGLKIARSIGDSRPFKYYGARFYSKSLPGCGHLYPETDEYWECWVKTLATSDHHPVGTCRMGPYSDPYAVVDNQFRVYGLRNIRVIDGSTMPEVISGNINIPTVMMAEKAADMIKEEHYYNSRPKREATARQL